MNNVLFIGGIHGVGKGTLCAKISIEHDIQHLTASEVLKWEEISKKDNKLVNDFSLTQNRLITNLQKIVTDDKKYVLDGHYSLLNFNQEPEKIDFETFKLLSPFAFVVVVDDVKEIRKRLEKRDKREYDSDLLTKFQDLELEYSIELSRRLKKPHLTLKNDELNQLNTFLHNENFA